jgi:hypothetical protein
VRALELELGVNEKKTSYFDRVVVCLLCFVKKIIVRNKSRINRGALTSDNGDSSPTDQCAA